MHDARGSNTSLVSRSLLFVLLVGIAGRGAADEPPVATPAPVTSPTPTAGGANQGTERAVPRRPKMPEPYTGPLSERFPEVEVRITTSFAHDRGVISQVESVVVAGQTVQKHEALAALVAKRQGWTAEGGTSDEDARRTVEAWELAWLERIGADYYDAPTMENWATRGPQGEVPAYHPPRATLHTLPDGERVIAFAYWYTYDAGNHGRGLSRMVTVYRLRDGSYRQPPYPPRAEGDLPRAYSATSR